MFSALPRVAMWMQFRIPSLELGGMERFLLGSCSELFVLEAFSTEMTTRK